MIQAPERGDRIGRYRVDDLVKAGGMASIYRGTDLVSGATVAIKIPRPELEADVLFFERFHREADIGRKLAHPGVVKVLPAEDDSRVCMVMEWVEGRPLRDLLDEEKELSPERAGRIALRICDALGYIHGHGIVHRDLKPDNIMIDSHDRIKLIDFGIARDAAARRLTFAKLTKSMGTPDYVSPEQVKGKRGDARSDIYSMGVIFYEMLTGEVPFRGPNPLVAMNQRLVADQPPLGENDSEIPAAFREIIRRAMEREPAKRYASARSFAHDLEHPDQIEISQSPNAAIEFRPRRGTPRLTLAYLSLALIPAAIFGLLLIIASHQ
jgi:eukaryotic-like serine/threonine-protein kinase